MISKFIFIDREGEISLLEEERGREKGRLIVLYGIFYIAEESSAHIQINGLKEKIAKFFNDSLLKTLENIRDCQIC